MKHAKVKDEPIKDLLGNITSELIERLLERVYGGDESKIPTVAYLGARPSTVPQLSGVTKAEARGNVEYQLNSPLPETSAWLETLAGPTVGWLRALVASPTIVQGASYIDNPIRRVLAPRKGQKVVISPTSVTVYGSARSHGSHKPEFKAVEIVYNASSSLIDLTMFEDRRDVSVPLSLHFQYKPSMASMPIHEIAEGRNDRIKQFYWKLWYGDDETLPQIDIKEKFTGPDVTIEASDIETFCSVVGNQGESFKTVRNSSVKAPMDFAIVTGWQVCIFCIFFTQTCTHGVLQAIMKSIFPSAIDGDLLKLVHLSNGFRMVEGARPLQVGDICNAKAAIASVTNTDAGKVVKVKGHVCREGIPVIEVVSAFLYRGRFTDFENTFETIDEPDYVVELENDAAVGVLESKEWFEWDDDSTPLQAGTSLTFRVHSQVTYKDKTSYRDVSVSGDIFVCDQLKRFIKVGSVDFQQDGCQGNPVVAYIQRHGKAQGSLTELPNGGYTLTNAEGSTLFNSPLTNEPYSKISGDFNPIHINPYFSDYATLPGTITHGLWSSAATRRYVENVVAQGHPDRVLA